MPCRKSARLLTLLSFACWVCFLLTACKKDKAQQEELPVLNTCKSVGATAGLLSPSNEWYKYQSGGGVTIKILRKDEGLTITLTDVSYRNGIKYNVRDFYDDPRLDHT